MRIYVRVIPRSSKTELLKVKDGEYKAKLTAPPVDGKANEQLIELIADHFDISKSSVNILGGKTAKTKLIEIPDASGR